MRRMYIKISCCCGGRRLSLNWKDTLESGFYVDFSHVACACRHETCERCVGFEVKPLDKAREIGLVVVKPSMSKRRGRKASINPALDPDPYGTDAARRAPVQDMRCDIPNCNHVGCRQRTGSSFTTGEFPSLPSSTNPVEKLHLVSMRPPLAPLPGSHSASQPWSANQPVAPLMSCDLPNCIHQGLCKTATPKAVATRKNPEPKPPLSYRKPLPPGAMANIKRSLSLSKRNRGAFQVQSEPVSAPQPIPLNAPRRPSRPVLDWRVGTPWSPPAATSTNHGDKVPHNEKKSQHLPLSKPSENVALQDSPPTQAQDELEMQSLTTLGRYPDNPFLDGHPHNMF
ncbi:hypothetical protein EJ08DRAFT_262769 [Tothia fuscella]|uniref:Uncharacterized protein n=1 Tax=Tothia fuscella TaxID=1048955 RepID=A0A9P4NQM4_9PEZI|nr:hypothetical protein EJ08DRAFT_262769 [Tothia fuscella]